MTDTTIIDFTLQALLMVLILSLGPILVAAVVGVLVSLVQAVTQIQDQTISFAVKLVAVIFTIILTARWVGGETYNFAMKLFEQFPNIVK